MQTKKLFDASEGEFPQVARHDGLQGPQTFFFEKHWEWFIEKKKTQGSIHNQKAYSPYGDDPEMRLLQLLFANI